MIGAGIFGCTIAIELARAGAEVHLYERHGDVMCGASRANQGRLHSGFHYPRSLCTAREVRDTAAEFAQRFPSTVYRAAHHYLVASDSRVSAEKYLAFCDELGLPYWQIGAHPLVRSDTVDLILGVNEQFVDLKALRGVLKQELVASGVNVHLNWTQSTDAALRLHGHVVDASYGQTARWPLRYELTEIALIRLGKHYAGRSFVVMDGPYISLDPVTGTDLHMLYDVEQSVHHASFTYGVPREYRNLVDRGPQYTELTRVGRMEQTARNFLRGFGMPEYRGSMFTVRAVLPDVDDTDARPTLVEKVGDVVHVLSGKIGTAVSAAHRVREALIR